MLVCLQDEPSGGGEISKFQETPVTSFQSRRLELWRIFGVWSLEFGIFPGQRLAVKTRWNENGPYFAAGARTWPTSFCTLVAMVNSTSSAQRCAGTP